ncbi:enoyl-CoA hydratase/carnithine racemase [Annulohypoxylon truncatum]|uniref:enoyl-CoA hydratase/carnithine racemase n=1 Tax=Annulohypoxylon truncatum TaxID=327061 RepID=UPI00200766AD|nr:enoyl-CoA hydratase/carnithine racemase [Annulohypoxylon truncatum]KAI1209588.1 enoyl-CoA hydratase/carnithine racemase [Annulohypoxylon truncatum]
MSPNTQLPPSLTKPPPPVPNTIVSFPKPHVLLVTLNRPKQLNAIPRPQHFALERLWDWFDTQTALRVAVITGVGRAFCAGADLKEWDGLNSNSNSKSNSDWNSEPSEASVSQGTNARFPPGGFGGMSNRGGLKPIVAAVNGICFGGAMEMAINCDMVVAAPSAQFALPEVTIGVIALAGALPRLVRCVGRQRAAEMALTGKKYGAREMLAWGLVNEVVEHDAEVLGRALEWAKRIAGNSPDAVIVTREGLKLGWEGVGPEVGTDVLLKGWYGRIDKGENMVEGVKSFVERRKPVWKDSKL